jgi:hypothetical protein
MTRGVWSRNSRNLEFWLLIIIKRSVEGEEEEDDEDLKLLDYQFKSSKVQKYEAQSQK